MPGPLLDRWQVGDLITAERLNALIDRVEQSLGSYVGEGYSGGAGLSVAPPDRTTILGEVLSVGAGTPPPHAWKEVYDPHPTTEGDLSDKTYGGIVGATDLLPLYEINGRSMAAGTRVNVWKGVGDYYLCVCPEPTTYSSSTVFSGGLEVCGPFRLCETTATTFSTPRNDFVPPTYKPGIPLEPTAATTFTGLVPSDTTTDEEYTLFNVGDYAITLKNEDTSSTDIHRLRTPNETDLTLPPGKSVTVRYDGSISRFRVLAGPPGLDQTPIAVTLSADQNNYTLTAGPVQLWDITTNLTVTGIVPPIVGAGLYRITNTGDSLLTLAHQSTSSSASNRIIGPNGTDLVVRPGATADLWYDDSQARWTVVGGTAASVLQTLYLPQESAPATPPTGYTAIYTKSDGLVYSKDDAAVETLMSGGTGGSSFTEGTLAATGTTQGTAAAITNTATEITSATAGVNDGVILPTAAAGARYTLWNASSATVNVYPPSGWQLGSRGANTAATLSPNTGASYYRTKSGRYTLWTTN